MSETTGELHTVAALTMPLRHVREPHRIHGRVMDVVNSRIDLVGPQSNLTANEDCSQFLLRLDEPVVLHSGVADKVLPADYTRSAWRHVHERLRIPVPYADRLVTHEHPRVRQLAADNINVLADVDSRRALFRYLETQEGLLLRAVRSDKYMMLDNDAALVAIVKGLAAHDLQLWDAEIDADITSDRLRMRIAVPGISIAARDLLADYRSPFTGETGKEMPLVWAGLEFTNSETGAGAFSVAPRAVFQVCRNGLTTSTKFRRAHLGAVLSEGEIDWSTQTISHALSLITSQVQDAVRTYLTTDYLDRLVAEMLAAKGVRVADVSSAVEVVQKRLAFSDTETRAVLDCMMRGADDSVFGLANAVTAAAQGVDDGDRQAEMEAAFWAIIEAPGAFVGVAP
jgi:hypothetical protein